MSSAALWSVPIASIFAREFMEATIIIGNFRTLVIRADWDEERKRLAHKNIWISSFVAFFVAFLAILGLGIGLSQAGSQLSSFWVHIIEGISKVVAGLAIGILSLKVPKWLGIYPSKKKKEDIEKREKETFTMSAGELRFNIMWNVWREMAETGAFLVPAFLNGNLLSIPISGIVGIVIGTALGLAVYFGNKYLKDKRALATFMAVFLGALACGLLTGGLQYIELETKRTRTAFRLPNSMGHWKLPFTIAKPFGYYSNPTVLMIVIYWGYAALLTAGHGYELYRKKKIEEANAMASSQVEVSVKANGAAVDV